MKFKYIEKINSGRFLHRYDCHYTAGDGSEICYELVSRDPKLDSHEKMLNKKADAVVCIVTDESDEHMLLCREFRMELGRVIFGLPGGLIEANESIEACAARELYEETGVRLLRVTEIFPPAPCAVGISDERAICVFAKGCGEPRVSSDPREEIESRWYTRQELLKLHETEVFGSWSLAYSRIWASGRLP